MQTVNVLYKYVDGAHFFVSGDDKSLGLCVAHKDPVKAFEAVAATLTKLFKENHNEDAIFHPESSSHAFQQWFVHRSEEAMTRPAPGISGVFPWSRADAA